MSLRFCISLFFSLLAVASFSSFLVRPVSCESVPSWFRKGVFVEVRFDFVPKVIYLGGVNYPGFHMSPYPGFLRWEVLDFEGGVARLDIRLMSNWSRRLLHQAEFYVNVSSREVFLLNGTSVGVTHLWLPANLKDGDLVPFNNNRSSVVMGRVSWSERAGPVRTCQGYQSSFFVESDLDIQKINDTSNPPFVDGNFDGDTGIMVMGEMGFDGALAAMGIQSLISGWMLCDTNVDLGPHVLTSDILAFFFVDYPFSIPVMVFASVFSVLLWRRNKRRHRVYDGIKTE